MRISKFHETPFQVLSYMRAAVGGSREWATLPFQTAHAEATTCDLDAIVCTSDLQGRENPDGRLLGEAVAAELISLCAEGALPPVERTGVLLAGDLFARPGLDRRGGFGNVESVWEAFGEKFHWVVGVAGNHDNFGGRDDRVSWPYLSEGSDVDLLDGRCIDRSGLRIGGLSGIIGPSRKPWRREEANYLEVLKSVADAAPDLLVLHDGPCGDSTDQRGSAAVRRVLDECPKTFVVRGHVHWSDPLVELRNGTQVLNVDGRVVVLLLDRSESEND